MDAFLKIFFPIADIIAGTLGNNCEVVVHDLSHTKSSIVYAANGDVTGRQVGQSFDHLIKQVLLNKNFKSDHVINYIFDTPDGKKVKSSSALIRDINEEVIGMICINCDLTVYQLMQEQINSFMNVEAANTKSSEEHLDQDIMTIIDQLILKIVGTADIKNLTRKKSVEIIRFMDKKGIFLVKGAIDKVADIMGVSKVTIYSYLDEAKGKR